MIRCAFVSVFLSLAATGAHAANWNVDVGGAQLAYSPQFLTIQAGDTVTFTNKGGFHSVLADDGSFHCAQGCDADGGNGNPSAVLWTATVAFPTARTAGFHCEVHGAPGQGMYGTITVDPAPPAPPQPAIDSVPNGSVLPYLLGVALIAGAAASWRRRTRSGR